MHRNGNTANFESICKLFPFVVVLVHFLIYVAFRPFSFIKSIMSCTKVEKQQIRTLFSDSIQLHSSWIFFKVNEFPTGSCITLKRHSTSSVVDAHGCSGGILILALSLLSHSMLSILVSRAMVVSRINPCTLLTGL